MTTEAGDSEGNCERSGCDTECNVGASTEPEEDYTPLCSNEDIEKQAAYNDYKLLEKNIKHQNACLEKLKENIQILECKQCLTNSEKGDLKNMYSSWEREMVKLQELIGRAINLQNLGSKRHYRELPVVTTFDEDNLKLTRRTLETLQDKTHKTHEKYGNFRLSGGNSSEMSSSCNGSQLNVADENKLMKEIFIALKECGTLKDCNKNKKPKCSPQVKDSMEQIKSKMKCMQNTIDKLTEEITRHEKCSSKHHSKHSSAPATDFAMLCLGKNTAKQNEFQQLKDNYLCLLTEFSKKDEELKQLTKKLRDSCSKCACGAAHAESTSADESELHLLRNRVIEMNEEQVEFKCLMREQSSQLDEYRNKYLKAQQTVEEQCGIIEKLNMNNKCIEKQINQEVKEIRAKFQDRLSDLLQFPKLLENEQIKLGKMSKEKEQIETKLMIVCKELKLLKSKQDNAQEDCKPQLTKCQHELNQAKKNIENLQRQRDMFCEQLKCTTEDLNTLRSESAKIIARTNERAEFIKQQQQDHIDNLEKQLARCRATASLSVTDRENVIKEMQGQLNTLSYSFDAAQKQIKTLRNHIAYMSNESSFPAKC